MPKSSHAHSPPQSASSSRRNASGRSVAESSGRSPEATIRKKKNAEAQASFRARRANYIATLEETVTSLEAVVVQLQDTCRDTRTEAQELRHENVNLKSSLETLRHESREREKYLRALWVARKSGRHDLGLDDFPPPPASFQMTHSPSNTNTNSLAGTPLQTHTNPVPYPTPAQPLGGQPVTEHIDPRVHYQPQPSPGPVQVSPAYHEGHGDPYRNRSPSLPFVSSDAEAIDVGSRPMDPRMQKICPYPVFNVQVGSSRDGAWTNANQPGPSTVSPTVPAHENGSSINSPAFVPSPHATTHDLAYAPRYSPLDTQKSGSDSVPYILGSSERSISPVVSSPHNSSSASINSQFQFVFPSEGQERGGEADYHQHHGVSAPEMTLHGGTADVSSYALNRQRSSAGPSRPMLGAPPTGPPHANNQSQQPTALSLQQQPQQQQEDTRSSPDKDPSSSEVRGTRRSRRLSEQQQAASNSDTPSRSPSPNGHQPISGTLAVIKAQAFGALRRTRARPQKTEHATKVAMEVLEARGIGIGLGLTTAVSSKRPRLHDRESM